MRSDLFPLLSSSNDQLSDSSKLLVLLSKGFLISRVILGSLINWPEKQKLFSGYFRFNSDLKASVAKDQVQPQEHRKCV